jgi:hypothetical protein
MFIGIVSCSDDEKETDYAKEIVGSYKGDIKSEDGSTIVGDTAIVNIVYRSENKVILKMNQKIAGLPIDIECNSEVKYADNEYVVSGNASFNYPIEGLSVPVSLPVSVSGKIDTKKGATLNISIATPDPSISIPLFPLTVVFTGTKQ